MPATYKDIQKLTGYSLSTISRYFNGKNVKPEYRNAIETAANKLDFSVNDFARGLKSGKSMSVGLLVPAINSEFATIIISHIVQFLRQRGYSCLICDCGWNKQAELEGMKFLIGKGVDGIITTPFDTDPAQLQFAKSRNVPVVLVDNCVPGHTTDAVVVDNYGAGCIAAKYLLGMGHKDVAVVSVDTNLGTMSEREKGFAEQYKKAGLDVKTVATSFDSDDGYTAIKGFLMDYGRTSAVFCTNYGHFITAMSAINELNLQLSIDISLVGFDNMQLTKVMKPSLATIEQPMEQISQQAVELLLKRLENTDCPPETVTLNAKLIRGDSVADLREERRTP